MSIRNLLFFFFSLLTIFSFNQKGLAQGNLRIRGRVINSQGRIISNAKVTARKESTEEIFKTKSKKDGTFYIQPLHEGLYLITVSAQGFNDRVINDYSVDLTKTEELEVRLEEKEKEEKIQDNSFLIEEAYNQEEGVVQHINNFSRSNNGDWIYTFTEELPIKTIKHQFSFTIPGLSMGEGPRQGGLGDIALNYRYQLVGNGDTRVAVTPRFSILLPTGDSKKELGNGSLGYQTDIAASVELSKRFVTHFNLGTTIIPSAKDRFGNKANTVGYSVGHSIVWLTKPTFNLLLETVFENDETVVGPGKTERENSVFISPGLRYAFNFKNGLQIVPGIAVPLGVGPSSGERAIFFYLSFEHPFVRRRP